jgi:hypothetical protein
MCLKSMALLQNFMKSHMFTINNGYAENNTKVVQLEGKDV